MPEWNCRDFSTVHGYILSQKQNLSYFSLKAEIIIGALFINNEEDDDDDDTMFAKMNQTFSEYDLPPADVSGICYSNCILPFEFAPCT